MTRCHVCGGATTCPEGLAAAMRSPLPGDVVRVRHPEPPEGHVLTHRGPDGWIAVRALREDGLIAYLLASGLADRFRAHGSPDPVWVGMCKYLLYGPPTEEAEAVLPWAASWWRAAS